MDEIRSSQEGGRAVEGVVRQTASRALLALDDSRVQPLVESFLTGRNERTLRAYRSDLQSFMAFVGVTSIEEAAQILLGRSHGEANGLALDYRSHLVEKGLSPATVNRRLAALRSLVRLGRTLGLVGWNLEVADVRRQAYRDTRGPGRPAFLRLLELLSEKKNSKGLRDIAIVRLLHDLALRREEVVSLDVEHLDLDGGAIAILGKGRTERETLTLPEPTSEALRMWLSARGTAPGPLFLNCDRASKGGRLTGRSVHRIVGDLGDEIGVRVRPHGLRHAGITEALDLTSGDVRAVQRFSRHRDVKVLMIYDDTRQDLGGRVARLVAGATTNGLPLSNHNVNEESEQAETAPALPGRR